MKIINRLVLALCFQISGLFAQTPVNPNAIAEVKILLNFLYEIRGNGMITGMHNFQQDPDGIDNKVKAVNGNIEPGLWGNDFRYGSDVQYRLRVANEAINQWKNKGKLVTYMYHQVRPMDSESDGWSSVQGDISDAEFDALLTDGSEINQSWKAKMGAIGLYFSILQDSSVPVIFRPYHEMNGGWFWWGQKKNEDRYKKLYRMTYHYLTDTLQLNNLLWILNYDDTNTDFASYYPGDGYVDAFTVDVYGGSFPRSLYNAMKNIAGNRPIAIGELDKMIDFNELTTNQTDWVWWMGWRDDFYLAANTDEQVMSHFTFPYMINSLNIIMDDTIRPGSINHLISNKTASIYTELSWNKSNDNSGKVNYHVFENSELIGKTIDTMMVIENLIPSTLYTFEIKAVDLVNNVSIDNAQLNLRTNDPDTLLPIMPDTLSSENITQNRIDIYWDEASDNEGIEKYIVYLDNDSISTTQNRYFFFKKLDPENTYKIELFAVDLSGNISDPLTLFLTTLPLASNIPDNKTNKFSIQPVPANEKFVIIPDSDTRAYSFCLLDANGRILYTSAKSNIGSTSVDISTFAKGVYYIILVSGFERWAEKLIVL